MLTINFLFIPGKSVSYNVNLFNLSETQTQPVNRALPRVIVLCTSCTEEQCRCHVRCSGRTAHTAAAWQSSSTAQRHQQHRLDDAGLLCCVRRHFFFIFCCSPRALIWTARLPSRQLPSWLLLASICSDNMYHTLELLTVICLVARDSI